MYRIHLCSSQGGGPGEGEDDQREWAAFVHVPYLLKATSLLMFAGLSQTGQLVCAPTAVGRRHGANCVFLCVSGLLRGGYSEQLACAFVPVCLFGGNLGSVSAVSLTLQALNWDGAW